jgi:tetratricopeptide (TPR) repeat protein
MYLPLAAVLTTLAVASHLTAWRAVDRGAIAPKVMRTLGVVLAVCVAATLGVLTFLRNTDYSSGELFLWQDVVNKMPSNTRAHYNLGIGLAEQGQTQQAIDHYRTAIRIKPDMVEAYNNLGLILRGQGQLDNAIAEFEAALKINPDYLVTYNNLGLALCQAGRYAEAVERYKNALKVSPSDAGTRNNLGVAMVDLGRIEEAIEQYKTVLQEKPDSAETHYNYANALMIQKRWREAAQQYQLAVEFKPTFTDALCDYALLLATCEEASVRNGAKAVTLAQRAVELTKDEDPSILDVLAAAHAEAGRFREAVQAARQALNLAKAQNRMAFADVLQTKLQLYESGKPYHETSSPSTPPSSH